MALKSPLSVYPTGGKVVLKPLVDLAGRDWAKFHSYFRDREIAELNGSNPIRMPLWLFRRVVVGEERSGERCGFGIFDQADVFIGSVEFYDLVPSKPRQPLEGTLGIVIGDKSRWGQHYGSDALQAALGHAFEVMGLRRVRLETLECNARARRAFERVGFVLTRLSVEAKGRRYAHYALAVENWRVGSKPNG